MKEKLHVGQIVMVNDSDGVDIYVIQEIKDNTIIVLNNNFVSDWWKEVTPEMCTPLTPKEMEEELRFYLGFKEGWGC